MCFIYIYRFLSHVVNPAYAVKHSKRISCIKQLSITLYKIVFNLYFIRYHDEKVV